MQKLYPDYDALQQALPHRSYYAIKNFAQLCNIASKRHDWTTPLTLDKMAGDIKDAIRERGPCAINEVQPPHRG